MDYRYYALSDKGLRRENNEDNYLVDTSDTKAGQIFAVADGMGGHAAGETASRIVCHELKEQWHAGFTALADQQDDNDELVFLMEKIIYTVHKKILGFAEKNPDLFGMGCTLSSLILRDSRGLIGHVGDSRIYRFRAGVLEQLTKDHTELQRYIDLGRLTKEEAASHHLRHILSQAIGGKSDSFSRAFTLVFDVEPGDIFLLCSDGLYDMTGDAMIEEVLAAGLDLQETGDKLLQKALDKGGKDNVTLLLVKGE
ncbi:MAG TPA: serine/threonine-protein phosphatase [Desulfobacterales bacterium]|nr:serine/threonine-protein phosphatase [Desulfobacterales bacterium]